MPNQLNDPNFEKRSGGYLDQAGYDLGNGRAAAVTVALTITKTTVGVATTSTELLATNADRYAARITNNGTGTLWLGVGVAALVGTGVSIGPGATVGVPAGFTGQVNGIWDGAGGTSAAVEEYTT